MEFPYVCSPCLILLHCMAGQDLTTHLTAPLKCREILSLISMASQSGSCAHVCAHQGDEQVNPLLFVWLKIYGKDSS